MWGDFDQRCFFRGNWDFDLESLKIGTDRKFASFYQFMVAEGASEYDLDRVGTAIFYLRTILARHGITGSNKTAVEIGCGTGNKSFAINDLFGHYVGIDLLDDQIDEAKRRASILNASNTRFICQNASSVLREPERFGLPGKIDFLLLYAVIEHLTPEERKEVLALGEGVINGGGTVLIMEAPNRLVPYDSHTTGSHFFNWLPDRLAYDFARNQGQRKELFEKLPKWNGEQANEQLYRLGRGVSYHDLEDAFHQDISEFGFPMGAMSCESLNMDPLQNQEIQLFGHLHKHLPHVPASSFCRSWIDTLISGEKGQTKSTKYLSPSWPHWTVYEEPPVFWEAPSIQMNSVANTWEAKPDTTGPSEIVLSFTGDSASLAISVNGERVDLIQTDDLKRSRPKRWHDTYSVAYQFQDPVSKIQVSVAGGQLSFHGALIHS